MIAVFGKSTIGISSHTIGDSMKSFLSIVCVYLTLAISACYGQSMDGPSGLTPFLRTGLVPGEYTVTYTVTLPPVPKTIFQGHPYSGEETHQQIQKLPDGSSLTQPGQSAILYRDSAGRMRTERTLLRPLSANPVNLPVVAEIFDPVTGYIYYLDSVNKIAHRMVWPRESMRFQNVPLLIGTFPTGTSAGPNSTTKSEPLGTKILDGIEAQGRRMTTAYTAGAMGNDRPMVMTTEIWISPELGVTILSKSSSPMTGDNISAILNISRAEPDSSLFQIPRDYKIQDEQTVPFEFTITNSSSAK
jgi:hypothetical protein